MLPVTALIATLATGSPKPVPNAGATPAASSRRRDPCGGAQELLKKYLAASPCVFVAGQASLQATYATTTIPADLVLDLGGSTAQVRANRSAIGYPGALVNIGISQNAQIMILPPSFSQLSSSTRGTLAAGATDMEFWYKQLVYVDGARGILGGLLLTYEAPTGSPGLAAPGPAYTINPLLNVATNRARTMGVSLAFPISNFATASSSGNTRGWSFTPQAVPFGALPAVRFWPLSCPRLHDQRHSFAAQHRAARHAAVSAPSDLWRHQLGRRSRESARRRHAGSGNVLLAHTDSRGKLHVWNQRPVTARDVDLLVIGAGPAGTAAALRGADLGATTALVTRGAFGGMAANDGPIPVRTLAHAARLIREARQLGQYGISTGDVALNYQALLARARQIVAEAAAHSTLRPQIDRAGVMVYEHAGTAHFVDANTIAGERSPTFRQRRW